MSNEDILNLLKNCGNEWVSSDYFVKNLGNKLNKFSVFHSLKRARDGGLVYFKRVRCVGTNYHHIYFYKYKKSFHKKCVKEEDLVGK